MPNHVFNRIEVSENVLDQIISKDKNGNDCFDFELIIPIPDYIYKGDIDLKDLELYGSNNSIDWCLKYWRTKWNSYSFQHPFSNMITFETANNHPFSIIKELSHRFPDEAFFVCYADENVAYNLGAYCIKNGNLIESAGLVEGSAVADKFATTLFGKSRYEIVLIEIENLTSNWDNYKGYPGVDEELEYYRAEVEDYEYDLKYFNIDYPDFDFSNLRSYLTI